ncbi:hypothetical protein [Actinoplanes sp. NPDC051851]|uniref:hypothetical protein n=1 Tax=Actinoplanes sp. NPDC051851 TaxID=3154753 RepID=UPI003442E733
MDHQHPARPFAAAHLLDEYQRAGLGLDGIHQMLLTHLRENRRTLPRPEDHAPLAAEIDRLGLTGDHDPAAVHPDFVIDGSVLTSFARLDNATVGAALIDAAADESCRILVSPLAYLRLAADPPAPDDAARRLHRLLNPPSPMAVVETAPLTVRQIDIMTGLKSAERPDTLHTALLALDHRCVIGTLDADTYHRIGYHRVLNLAR